MVNIHESGNAIYSVVNNLYLLNIKIIHRMRNKHVPIIVPNVGYKECSEPHKTPAGIS